MPGWRLIFALTLISTPAAAQLPPSIPLSDADRPLFQAEIARFESLLRASPNQANLMYLLGQTCAAAKQWPEALDWLRKAVDLRSGLDPLRDSAFAPLRGTREFASIQSAVREATPSVSHSHPAFVVGEGDLVPESIAYDPRGKQFYLGSLTKGKVIRCSPAGDCAPFAQGLGTVVGLKVQNGGLWLLDNSERESALIHYDLASARIVYKYVVTGSGHLFNDLAFSPKGDVYLTDTRAASVWVLSRGASHLSRLPGKFTSANGIALSSKADLLFVSSFPDGITLVDLKTHAVAPIAHPAGICLAFIDGLYCHRGALIAIQNGMMNPRVVRFKLSGDRRAIEQMEVRERRNPLFDGITTGVIAGSDFFYMANIQDDKQTSFNPIVILKLPL